jgi:hypothetical protein
MSSIKTNFGILKTNIQRILIHCERPITKESINTYINGNNTSLKKNYPLQIFTFDSILKDLENIKNYMKKTKNINMYNSVNKYLNIWKEINSLLTFTDKQENKRNNKINSFLHSENSSYIPDEIKFHRLPYSNNNEDNRF